MSDRGNFNPCQWTSAHHADFQRNHPGRLPPTCYCGSCWQKRHGTVCLVCATIQGLEFETWLSPNEPLDVKYVRRALRQSLMKKCSKKCVQPFEYDIAEGEDDCCQCESTDHPTTHNCWCDCHEACSKRKTATCNQCYMKYDYCERGQERRCQACCVESCGTGTCTCVSCNMSVLAVDHPIDV